MKGILRDESFDNKVLFNEDYMNVARIYASISLSLLNVSTWAYLVIKNYVWLSRKIKESTRVIDKTRQEIRGINEIILSFALSWFRKI